MGRLSVLLATAVMVGACSQSDPPRATQGDRPSGENPTTTRAPGTTAVVTVATVRTLPDANTTIPERLVGLPLGQPGCAPPSPFSGGEFRGTPNGDVELYGLSFARRIPIRAGDEVKIVWRMTGVGGLDARSISPSGQPVALSWIEQHTSSNYNRPGDEWGTGYVFSEPGCWHLTFERTNSHADVWLHVEP